MDATVVAAAYVRALASSSGPGETVQLMRPGNAGVFFVQAWVTDFIPQDLSGAVQQGRRTAVVLASSVVASGFPLPFAVKSDRLVWALNGTPKSNVINKVDDATRRIQGVLIAYDLDLEGA